MYSNLNGKKIVYGITGSIAAYKSTLVIRELIKAGAEVKAVMTPTAANFVTPLVIENLTRQNVLIDMFDINSQTGGALHIDAAHNCDLMMIAPCSATTLGKLANSICDNALVSISIALPSNIPFVVAPSMDSTMWQHSATQRSLEFVKNDGAIIIPPVEGDLSSGLRGPGRFPEISDIVKVINSILGKDDYKREIAEKPLETVSETVDINKFDAELELEKLKMKQSLSHLNGKKVLINAGPTHEKIDAVRYISNYSSGKMGFALAKAALQAGAEVTLVTGPVNLDSSEEIERIDVISAREMYEKCIEKFPEADIAILSAAVADFTPEKFNSGKIKKDKTDKITELKLKKTDDILQTLGNMKRGAQLLIGFALETENEIQYGKDKLKRKNCDMIVVNKANEANSGFGGDNNTITVLKSNGMERNYKAMSKKSAALEILRLAK